MVNQYALGDEIIRKLKSSLRVSEEEFAAFYIAKHTRDPFKVLVVTILSQNTAEKNTFRAFYRLEEKVGVSPENILNVDIKEIEDAIKPAGLYRGKARAIRLLAEVVQNELGGNLSKLLEKGVKEVRETLGKIPGIGEKTIDVLLVNWGYPVIPIDTHIRRVSLRLGLTSRSNYRSIREALHRIFREEVRADAHLYLIKMGRTFCKPKKPLCDRCPLKEYCKYRFQSRSVVNFIG